MKVNINKNSNKTHWLEGLEEINIESFDVRQFNKYRELSGGWSLRFPYNENELHMKSIKIDIPEGYEIDKDKSTYENIVFKEIDSFPMSWEDLKYIKGYYINNKSSIHNSGAFTEYQHRNIIPSKAEAEGILALIQLLQLRDRVNGGWKPDWSDMLEIKYNIDCCECVLCTTTSLKYSYVMHFKTKELRDRFLKVHRDLLEKAKMFL